MRSFKLAAIPVPLPPWIANPCSGIVKRGKASEAYSREDFFAVHELSLISEVIRIVDETLQAEGAACATEVRLRVGALSGALPDALRFAWEAARRDSRLAGASLEIETISPSFWCRQCQAEFAADDLFNECPRCHQLSTILRRGRELEISSVEII